MDAAKALDTGIDCGCGSASWCARMTPATSCLKCRSMAEKPGSPHHFAGSIFRLETPIQSTEHSVGVRNFLSARCQLLLTGYISLIDEPGETVRRKRRNRPGPIRSQFRNPKQSANENLALGLRIGSAEDPAIDPPE